MMELSRTRQSVQFVRVVYSKYARPVPRPRP